MISRKAEEPLIFSNNNLWRTVILILIVALALSACISPRTLEPVAKNNQENVINLHSNLQTLIFSYGDHLNGLLSIQRALLEAQAKEAIIDYTKTTTEFLDEDKLTKNLPKSRDELRALQSSSDETKRQQIAFEYAASHPFIGDIAAGFILKDEAEKIVKDYMALKGLSLEVRRVARSRIVSRLAIMRQFEMADQDIQNAYSKFSGLLQKESAEAVESAQAILAFSQSKTGFRDLVEAVTSVEVQTGIGEFIKLGTDNPDRKKAAEDLLNRLAESGKKASEEISAKP